VVREATGVGQFADFRGEILADAGKLVQAVGRQVGHALGAVSHRVGRRAIGADAEGVLALDLEQVRDLLEDPGDGGVLHGARPTRSGVR